MNDDLLLRLLATFSEIPGKKVFQKLCYFLQEAEGGRLGARFRMKHFGPYSEELDALLEDLQERKLVTVGGSSEDGYRISTTTDTLQELSPEEDAALERLVKNFRGDLNRGLTLEALATAHFLAQANYTGSVGDRTQIVKQVQAWKGRKFKPQFIEDCIDRLESMGYLAARN